MCVNQSHQILKLVGQLFAILALGGHSFKQVLDLSRKSRQNWGMGRQSVKWALFSWDCSNRNDIMDIFLIYFFRNFFEQHIYWWGLIQIQKCHTIFLPILLATTSHCFCFYSQQLTAPHQVSQIPCFRFTMITRKFGRELNLAVSSLPSQPPKLI